MNKILKALGVVVLAALAPMAGAVVVTVDEYGNGRTDTGGRLAINAGPYDRTTNPLTYTLPFVVTNGAFLQLCEEISNNCSSGNNGESDLIGFVANSNVLKFWSDHLDNSPPEPGVLADTGFPDNINNPLQRTEVALTALGTGFLGVTYTPTSTQPGFVTGQTTTYIFVSDGRLAAIPEPSSLALLGIALAGLAASRSRKVS